MKDIYRYFIIPVTTLLAMGMNTNNICNLENIHSNVIDTQTNTTNQNNNIITHNTNILHSLN